MPAQNRPSLDGASSTASLSIGELVGRGHSFFSPHRSSSTTSESDFSLIEMLPPLFWNMIANTIEAVFLAIRTSKLDYILSSVFFRRLCTCGIDSSVCIFFSQVPRLFFFLFVRAEHRVAVSSRVHDGVFLSPRRFTSSKHGAP